MVDIYFHIIFFFPTKKVIGYRQLLGYQHYSKYHLLDIQIHLFKTFG